MNRADYNVGNLESEIKVQFEQAVSALNQTTTALDGVVSLLKDTNSQLNNLKNNTGLKEVSKQAKELSKINFGDAFKSTIKFGAIYSALRKGFNTVKDIVSASIDMIETTNLFEVQMGKVVDEYGNLDEAQSQYYTKAMTFQDKMNEKLATNKSEMQKYQAMYYGMLNSQLGSSNRNASYLMSESLTKAGYDIASLYNLDVETAMNKLKSGLAGQIESLRQIGIDVSEASLAKILDQVGIERSVQQLSYAEKEVARYIAICQQAGQAQGDFARTFEQPANQIRVFKNQMIELKQVAGSFFVGLFGQIMPVINGIIMAIKEVLKALGSVFGFEINTGNSSLGTVADTVGDIDSGIGSATKKAKEFKKQLMGFDEINNITPPSENGGGSGGGSSVNGIDSALLDALKEWDNKMDSISGKAQEIRDKILDWLGVTDGSYENLKKIWEVVKEIGAGLLAWKFSKKFLDFLQNLGVLKNINAFQLSFGIGLSISGIWAMWNGTKRLLDGDVDIFSLLETFLGIGAGAFGIVNILRSIKNGAGQKIFSLGESFKIGFGVVLTIQGFEVMTEGIKKGDIGQAILGAIEGAGGLAISIKTLLGNMNLKNAVKSINEWFTSFNKNIRSFIPNASTFVKKATSITAGIAGITASSSLTYNTMKDLREGTIGSAEAMAKLTSGLGLATVSGAIAGSQFGLFGTIIGGVAGFIASATSALFGYNSANNETKEILDEMSGTTKTLTDEIKSNKEAYEESVKSIKDSSESKLVDLQYSKNLSEQLKDLVDENGKVIKGNEARVDFIFGELNEALGLELSRDGEIIKKGDEVVNSYKQLQSTIDDTIKKKEEEARLAATQELYKEAIKEEIKAKLNVKKAQENYNKVLKESNDLMEKGKVTQFADIEQLFNNVNEAKSVLDDANGYLEDMANNVKNMDAEMTNEMVKQTGSLSKEMLEQGKISSSTLQNMVTNSTDEWEKAYDELEDKQKASMLAQSTTLDTWSPTIQQKWADMANNSADDFLNGISQVEPAVQSQILSSLTTTETLTPQMEEAWQNLAQQSNIKFKDALSNVDIDTQSQILQIITRTQGLTETTANAWAQFAKSSEDKYKQTLAGMDTDTSEQIQAVVNVLNGNYQTIADVSGRLGNAGKESFKTGLGNGSSSATNFIQGFQNIINLQKNNPYSGFLQAIGGLASKALQRFNSTLGIASPSRETKKSARFFAQGFNTQLKKELPNTISEVSNFANKLTDNFNDNIGIQNNLKGIKINTKDFTVDTNQYVNYSAIRGQIQTQSQISVDDNIADKIAEAVTQSMRNTEVNVNIEAKTEEGIIFKKVQNSAREYTMQTGQPAFDY